MQKCIYTFSRFVRLKYVFIIHSSPGFDAERWMLKKRRAGFDPLVAHRHRIKLAGKTTLKGTRANIWILEDNDVHARAVTKH